jgi:glycerol-3-phosphate dehydrogenase (NAD(P)+)
MIGVQVGGAVKNVLAIGCGIVQGKSLGNNAKAAVLTRGLAEMQRLGVALGGQRDTFLGLSGVGDLTLTGSSVQSRNFTFGVALGEGCAIEDILSTRHSVTEGVATSAAIKQLADQHNVRMPICQGVYKVLHDGVKIDTMIEDLLATQADFEL